MSISTSVHEIKTLVLSFHPVIVIETVEEGRAITLLKSVADQLWLPLFEWTMTLGLVRASDGDTIATTNEPFGLLRHLQGLSVEGLFVLKDFARHLDDAKVARQFRETAQSFARGRSTMVLIGSPIHLPADIEPDVVRYELKLPDRDELLKVVYAVIQSLKTTRKVETQLREEDREQLLLALQGLTLNQARQAVAEVIINADRRTAEEDIRVVLKRKAQMIQEGGLLEYYPVEDNRFQLGGFANLKAWLERQRIGFTQEARALNLSPPRGILIVGVPGCGKSLAAKVIAREWKLPLVKLDAGRLFDKFIGESEKNFRKAIAMAESMAPVVLWIDEIEKGMVSTGGGEADAGLSRRLFGAFLTWLQEKRQEVFVVATANDLSNLPPELLRKARFDEIFFVDLPDSQEREVILKIHLTLRKQDPATFDCSKIVASCDGFSGAEIEQAVVGGLYRALSSKRPLSNDLLLEEISHTIPLSVTRREDIEHLREMAKGRFVSVR
jgi:SpoVK/Ycf46/Vps4 family AAA+-type ATPase